MNRSTSMPLVACLMVLVLIVSACGTPAAPPTTSGQNPTTAAPTAVAGNELVTLSLWIFEGEEEFLPRLQEAFESKYPNIKLEITEIPED